MGFFSTSTKEDHFITQLKLQATKTIDCVAFLQSGMDCITDDIIRQNNSLMDELIDIKMLLIDDLQNTFITPLDREDIYHISVSLLGIAKYSQTTLEEMHMLGVKPDQFIRDMVEKVKAETIELSQAIIRLMKNPGIAYDHVVNVSKLEMRIDKIYREAVKKLLAEKNKITDELQQVLQIREVYRHLSNMSDKAENAADAIGMAIIKLS